MAEGHATAAVIEMRDPLTHPPPKGLSLLLINEGGTLIIGPWYAGALCWSPKPKMPQTVKERMQNGH